MVTVLLLSLTPNIIFWVSFQKFRISNFFALMSRPRVATYQTLSIFACGLGIFATMTKLPDIAIAIFGFYLLSASFIFHF